MGGTTRTPSRSYLPACRQADRQTDRQTGRQGERQGEICNFFVQKHNVMLYNTMILTVAGT